VLARCYRELHLSTNVESGSISPLQSQIDQSPIRAIQIQVLLLCVLVTLIEGVDLALIPLLAKSITQALSLQQKEFGVVLSALPVGLIIGGAFMGYLGDLLGRRPALIAAMVLMTVATLATAFVHTVPMLLACRVLTGIAFGGVFPAAMALVSEWMPERIRANVLAMVALGVAGGQLLASQLVKLPIAMGPWQSMVIYVGVACGVVTLILMWSLPESPRYLLLKSTQHAKLEKLLLRLRIGLSVSQLTATLHAEQTNKQADQKNQFAELFTQGRSSGTLLLWCTFVGVCAVVSFFSNSLPNLYNQAGKANSADAMGAYAFGAIVGGLMLPLLARRWHANHVLIAAIVLAGAVTALQGWVLPLSDALNLSVAALCGAFVSGSFFILYPPAVRFYPTAIRSTGIGAAVAVGRFGNVVTPVLAGWMLDAGYTPSNVFVAMAIPLALSCVAMFAFHRATKNSTHTASMDSA
jgi:MFS transporter, AAHS family, 4-hydroxybenzoate transporter